MKKPNLASLRTISTIKGEGLPEAVPEPTPEPEPASKPKKAVPEWQKGKRAVTVWVDERQYRTLNEISFAERRPVRALVAEALNLLLPKYDHLPIPDAEKK
jgi:hypothetical protein